ncbi:MAG TPA: ATP-binding protein [Verrucomicrobiota bacterium]|nr:ATP-binding protein [Verrucomicrobiota bacterium]
MFKTTPTQTPEALQAYADYESQITIRHLRFGCYLVMLLMPAGFLLDYFVYPDKVVPFLQLRFLASLLGAVILLLLRFEASQRFHRELSLVIALIPAFFICVMIYATEGPLSPYYAGLNLVLLAIALVMRWSVDLSITASLSVIAMYLAACFLNGRITDEIRGTFVNNLYFLVLTSGIVVVGGRLHRMLRIREFNLRYELDKNKKALEQKTADLETAIIRLKEAEAELVQNEKLASLGRMSAGIIHEVNNPLNYIKTNLYTLKNKSKYLPAEQVHDYTDTVKDIEDGIDRVKTIVSDLRGFTTHKDDQREEVAVADLVEASVRFVSHEWGDAIQLQKNLAPGQTILANKNKLIQVLVNLLENSLDALGAKQFTNGESPAIHIESRVESGTSILKVRDNGPGIKKENLDKIFDPFFTTKDVGAGMGLGLSICYRIMQDFNGRITVKSEPGKFTEFALEFPAKG